MMKLLIIAVLIILFGCGDKQSTIAREDKFLITGIAAPDVYLRSGIKVKISDDQSATMFGYDNCPSPNEHQTCVKLVPNRLVSVRLIFESGVVGREKWRVNVINGDKYTLSRPNGFMVKPDQIEKYNHVINQ